MAEYRQTYETSQPWVVYTWGRTHDEWWPFWNSTRVLGRSRIGLTCCVCGHKEVTNFRIPRWGKVPEPVSGRHPEREQFLREHAHPDRGHPISWALPMLNMAVHEGGLNLDLFAARLEADLNNGEGA